LLREPVGDLDDDRLDLDAERIALEDRDRVAVPCEVRASGELDRRLAR
jgi:hypothetical protein